MAEKYQLLTTIVTPTGQVRAKARMMDGRIVTVIVPISRTSSDDIREAILAAAATQPPPPPVTP